MRRGRPFLGFLLASCLLSAFGVDEGSRDVSLPSHLERESLPRDLLIGLRPDKSYT